jgi:hypothetical protein
MGATNDLVVTRLAAVDDVAGISLYFTVNDPWPHDMTYGLDAVEIFVSATDDRTTATYLGEGKTSFLHAGLSRGAVRYYWARARDKYKAASGGPGYGAWYPSSPDAGVQGTELSGDVLIAGDGYWKNPNGLIHQWGEGDTTFTNFSFSIPFPNHCLNVQTTLVGPGIYDRFLSVSDFDLGIPVFICTCKDGAGTPKNDVLFYWVAIGY